MNTDTEYRTHTRLASKKPLGHTLTRDKQVPSGRRYSSTSFVEQCIAELEARHAAVQRQKQVLN